MAATIQLLGQCAVRDAGDRAPLRIERQEQALLSYMLIHGKAVVQRERLIELFWPERPPENGCRCLSTALWRLHRNIAPAAGIRIESSRAGWIRLCAEDGVKVDLWEFRQCLADVLDAKSRIGVLPEGARIRLERAAALYQGALCPHLDHDWLIAERAAVEDQYLDCLLLLAGIHEAQDNHVRALIEYRQVLAVNRSREDAHSKMMMIFWKLGWRERAIRQYEHCAAALRADLDVAPMPETQALFRAILDGAWPSDPKAAARSEGYPANPALYARVLAIQERVEHAQADLANLLRFMHATDEAPLFPFMLEPDAAERALDC